LEVKDEQLDEVRTGALSLGNPRVLGFGIHNWGILQPNENNFPTRTSRPRRPTDADRARRRPTDAARTHLHSHPRLSTKGLD